MISVEEACALIVAGFSPLAAEVVSVDAALSRVLARDVAARLTQPPADLSAMDGYAVRAADLGALPAEFTVIGESAAGAGFDGIVDQGQAVRIFTGAPVPDGADTIVIQEVAERRGAVVALKEASPPGRHIRRRGFDFASGDVILRAGRRLSAIDLALAAAANIPWLAVRRRPRVAVLATGDELVMPGEPMGATQIVNSASVMVAAMLRGFGAEVTSLGIVRDDEHALAEAIAGARGADVLVTIGGASVGDHDLVRHLLATAGASLSVHKIAMRPGKPVMFGRLGDLPVLGLPGNPVSAGVTALLFARPAIAAMLGLEAPRQPGTARLGCAIAANDRRESYLRARFSIGADGSIVATPFGQQDSAGVGDFARADCLIVRPPLAAAAGAGERVTILPLRPDV